MYVKPRSPELWVLDPALGDYLPPEGREVPDTDYWRRLRDVFGDVVEAEPPAKEDAPAPAEPGAAEEAR